MKKKYSLDEGLRTEGRIHDVGIKRRVSDSTLMQTVISESGNPNLPNLSLSSSSSSPLSTSSPSSNLHIHLSKNQKRKRRKREKQV